jgi:3-methylfumaryl-CoA hydratase
MIFLFEYLVIYSYLNFDMQENQPNVSVEICSLSMVRRVAAMLDLDPKQFNVGDFLPKTWHFFMLAGNTKKSALRADGFPGFGVEMPNLGLPRLLLGGRTVTYKGNIKIGSEIRKTSFVKAIKEKTTANGRMAIVEIQHELRPVLDTNTEIIETQTYILLENKNNESNTNIKAQSSTIQHQTSDIQHPTSNIQHLTSDIKNQTSITPDETLLFQYSALGFNSHKIHLDRDYAKNVEGLPDLVINGGLLTLLATEYLQNDLKINFKELKVKHIAPLFCKRPFTFELKENELKIYNENNELAVCINFD